MEIEGGLAYLEMLNNGVSEKTARAIATGVGAVNAGLEFLHLDELVKAYKVLDKTGADDSFLKIVLRELAKRGVDVAKETGQEVLQEGVTTAGAQLGSKLDTGEWAYNAREVLNRLWNTAKESTLTFGLTNGLSAGHNINVQNQNRLVAAGEARLRAGEMPTPEQLKAMNLSEAEACGKMVMMQMDKVDEKGVRLLKNEHEKNSHLDRQIEQNTTANKFNIDEVRPRLKTESNTAFFWSGKTNGVGGAEIAADIAKSKKGVTLESAISSNGISMPEWDFNNPLSMDAWDMASAAYAEQASGEVHAVIGSELRPGNIWENIELPRLMENPGVTKITIIDPDTGLEKIIFER